MTTGDLDLDFEIELSKYFLTNFRVIIQIFSLFLKLNFWPKMWVWNSVYEGTDFLSVPEAAAQRQKNHRVFVPIEDVFQSCQKHN